MPKLIHLNGPCGIGKSTVAQLYIDSHLGALNLDLDQIAYRIGGWRENFGEALGQAARLAEGMAATHLGSGHDVVLPQLMVAAHEIDPFAQVARDNRAEFHEVVLMAGRACALDRVAARSAEHADPDDIDLDQLVAQRGGQELRAQLYDELCAFLHARPAATVISTDSRTPTETYAALIQAVTAPPHLVDSHLGRR